MRTPNPNALCAAPDCGKDNERVLVEGVGHTPDLRANDGEELVGLRERRGQCDGERRVLRGSPRDRMVDLEAKEELVSLLHAPIEARREPFSQHGLADTDRPFDRDVAEVQVGPMISSRHHVSRRACDARKPVRP